MEVHELEGKLLPREKLFVYGASALSDSELTALLIGSGSKEKNVFKLAQEVVKLIDSCGMPVSEDALLAISGLGRAKAAKIVAAFELARRFYCTEKVKVVSPSDVIPLIQHYNNRTKEHFLAISLNGAHEVVAIRVVSIGLVNRAVVHPREVFADVIQDRAVSVLVAHNHPSGNLEPSPEDFEVTKRLKKAGTILGIELLDHIIFSQKGFYSFLEHNNI